MNPMKDVEGVEETRFLTYKVYVSMGNNSVKNNSIKNPIPHAHIHIMGGGGGAMVLGKLPVSGRPTIWISVGQGPTALEVGSGGVVWTFLVSSVLSVLFLPLFGRRPDID